MSHEHQVMLPVEHSFFRTFFDQWNGIGSRYRWNEHNRRQSHACIFWDIFPLYSLHLSVFHKIKGGFLIFNHLNRQV